MAVKKKFIKIQIPILNEEIKALGTPETLNERTIKIDLSRKLRGRNLEMTLLLKTTNEEIVAYPKQLKLAKQYISRVMRKRINYVEDSFQAECKDIICTIKPFLITRKKVSRAIRQNLRKTTKEFLNEYVKDRTYLEVCEGTLYAEIQKELSIKLKKIYPLSFCEIRVLETKQLNKADLTRKTETRQEDEEQDNEEINLESNEENSSDDEETKSKKVFKKKE